LVLPLLWVSRSKNYPLPSLEILKDFSGNNFMLSEFENDFVVQRFEYCYLGFGNSVLCIVRWCLFEPPAHILLSKTNNAFVWYSVFGLSKFVPKSTFPILASEMEYIRLVQLVFYIWKLDDFFYIHSINSPIIGIAHNNFPTICKFKSNYPYNSTLFSKLVTITLSQRHQIHR
jgi:hypothetical protein